ARACCRTSCSSSTLTTRRWWREPRSPMTMSSRFLMLCATLVLLGGLAMATSRAAMQPTSRRADTPQTGFLFESIDVDGRTYDYAIYVPRGYDPAKQWPVVMFLHGMGESGTDGQNQLRVGLGPAMMARPQAWQAIVIMPQKPVARD